MRSNKRNIRQFLDQIWPTPPKHEVQAACERVWKRIETELDKHDTSLRSLYGDGWNAEPLNQREFRVLTAASTLGPHSDMGRITDLVEGWTRGGTQIGFVYATLAGLAERDLIKIHKLPAASEAAEPDVRFEVTEKGELALRRAKAEGKVVAHVQEDGLADRSY